MIPLSVSIAVNYLFSKCSGKAVYLFSIASVIVGVASIIIVTSLMNGLHTSLLDKVLGISGHVAIYSKKKEFENAETIYDWLGLSKEIKFILPSIQKEAIISKGEIFSGVLVYGLEEESMRFMLKNKFIIPPESLENGSVIIGAELAKNLKVRVGDKITLMVINDSVLTVIGNMPRIQSYSINGIFETGLIAYDSSFVYVSTSDARKLFKINNPNSFEIFLNNPALCENSKEGITKKFSNAYATTWKEKQKNLLEVLQMESQAMFLILTIMILIASLSIVSTIVILVQSKKKDIAILRTMGMSSREVGVIFFTFGGLIGVIGTVLGLIVGIIVTTNIDLVLSFFESLFSVKKLITGYGFEGIPTNTMPLEVMKICTISLLLCTISGIYPAFLASRVSPSEILR